MVWNTLSTSAAPGDVITSSEQNKQAQNVNHIVDDSVLLANASAALTLTTSFADIAGATISLAKDGTWLVAGDFFFDHQGADGQCRGTLHFDGAASGFEVIVAADNGLRPGSRHWLVVVSSQPKTAKLQAKKDSGAAASTASSATISAIWCKPT